MQRSLVHHAQRAVHHARKQTLDEEAAPEEAHQVSHRIVLTEGHQRAEIPVRVGKQGSPRSRRSIWRTICAASWCAACARGGTGVGSPGRGQAAQSPIAKMSRSRVVCNVGSTTSWLMRLTSSPSRRRHTSRALTPAAHTTSSEEINEPSASCTPLLVIPAFGRSDSWLSPLRCDSFLPG